MGHPFRVIKCQFGSTKNKYKGLTKNLADVVTLSELSYLWMARMPMMKLTQGRACVGPKSGDRPRKRRRSIELGPVGAEMAAKAL